jgi:sugar transferase (PEP-CTERM/EpsH1 system associated)
VHILWIKTELLHPVDKGGRIRTYNMLRELRREHRVTYLTLDDGTAAPDALARADEYCHEVVRVPFATRARGSAGFFGELLGNLASSLPYAVAKYRSEAMRREIERLARDVDVVVCDFLAPSINVPDGLAVPTVLFQHNVEAMIWERHASVAGNPIRRAYMHEQWRRMLRHERAECLRFDHVVAVSDKDADVFRRDFRAPSVSAVPTGVDTAYFRPNGTETREPLDLVFTGSMDWMPNEDAILFFIDQILPRIRAQIAGVTFTIVGRNPTARVRALAETDTSVRVTGSVPDVRPYIERAAAFVVPIRVGGGTRLKIYEAMGMERPVVSTTIGAEGLPVTSGVDAIIADEPGAFADAVVALLRDPVRAAAIGQAAATVVRERFGWDRVAALFAQSCHDVAARRRPDRASAPLSVVAGATSGDSLTRTAHDRE